MTDSFSGVYLEKSRHNFYMPPNETISVYGRIIGPHGIAIYNALWYYRNSSSETCYPSYRRIAALVGVSDRIIGKYIKSFEIFGLIQVVGKRENGTPIYSLPSKLPVKEDTITGGSRCNLCDFVPDDPFFPFFELAETHPTWSCVCLYCAVTMESPGLVNHSFAVSLTRQYVDSVKAFANGHSNEAFEALGVVMPSVLVAPSVAPKPDITPKGVYEQRVCDVWNLTFHTPMTEDDFECMRMLLKSYYPAVLIKAIGKLKSPSWSGVARLVKSGMFGSGKRTMSARTKAPMEVRELR